MASVTEYTNFQDFLQAWRLEQKAQKRNPSFQMIAQALGLRSKGHAHRLFHDPSVSLSLQTIQRLADLTNLKGRDREYFEALVQFNKTRISSEKQRWLRRMTRCISNTHSSSIHAEIMEYLSEWYLPILREVLNLDLPNLSPRFIHQYFFPSIKQETIENGIKRLLEMKLVHKRPGGRYGQTQKHLHVPGNLEASLLTHYQKEMMEIAAQALDSLPPQDREMGTLTFSLSVQNFALIKAKIKAFQEELTQEILQSSGSDNAVYQFNYQCFPVFLPRESA